MLRKTLSWLSKHTSPLPQHRDTSKSPKLMKEVGAWLYKKETMSAFQLWCRERQVRAYGNIKMTSNPQFARCLRVNDKRKHLQQAGPSTSATVIEPGQGIITVPLSACFNFLTVAREMSETPDSVFPIQLSWLNYNQRLAFLKSTAEFELAQAGWMVRISSFAEFVGEGSDSSEAGKSSASSSSSTGIGGEAPAKRFMKNGNVDFSPYVGYLLEDTRGRDGVAQGISREREEDSGLLDHYFSEMATDCCEDPEVFLEKMFIALAVVFNRSQPIESEAIDYFMRGGVNFFKAKKSEMFVPTLMPLIDCVPQREDGSHNTVVEFFPYTDEETLKRQLSELRIPYYTKGDAASAKAALAEERVSAQGTVERVMNVEYELPDTDLLRGGGFFALRALQPLEAGDVLYVRRFPWLGGDAGQVEREAQVAEANRILSFDA